MSTEPKHPHSPTPRRIFIEVLARGDEQIDSVRAIDGDRMHALLPIVSIGPVRAHDALVEALEMVASWHDEAEKCDDACACISRDFPRGDIDAALAAAKKGGGE